VHAWPAKRFLAVLDVEAHGVDDRCRADQGPLDGPIVMDIPRNRLQRIRVLAEQSSSTLGVPGGDAHRDAGLAQTRDHTAPQKTRPAEHCHRPAHGSRLGAI
jgi:hypothetical protein